MIHKKLIQLLEEHFSIIPDTVTEESFLVEDLGLDLEDLAMALEECFSLDELDDLSNLTTIEELIDFLQRELEM